MGDRVGASVRVQACVTDRAEAITWRGHHEGLGRPVLVKVWKTSFDRSQRDAIVSFHQQAKQLARLESAHVLKVIEHGLDAIRRPYLVFEHAEGEPLSARLVDHEPISSDLDEVVDVTGHIIHQLTAALGDVHDRNMVVGELSPERVLLVGERDHPPVVKLLEFGLPGSTTSGQFARTSRGEMLGALEVVAPEQVHPGSEVDARADHWSLGVIAYRMLTGRRPFARTDHDETLRAMATGDFILPSRHLGLNDDLGRALDAWFVRALAPRPSGRFASAEAMSEAWPDAKRDRASDAGHFAVELDADLYDDELPTRVALAPEEATHDDEDEEISGVTRVREVDLPLPIADDGHSGVTAVRELLGELEEMQTYDTPTRPPPWHEDEAERARRERLERAVRARIDHAKAMQRKREQTIRLTLTLTVFALSLISGGAMAWVTYGRSGTPPVDAPTNATPNATP